MRTLLLVLFCASVWILPGYLPRVILRRTDPDKGTSPEERTFGFALLALLCLLSLRYVGNPIWGAMSGTVAVLGAAVVAWRRGIITWPRADWSWVFLIKLVCLLGIAAIYVPLICGWRTEYRLPAIFDLPKQLAAVASITHATRWPAPNPFAPGLTFAYNLLFYMPAGVQSRLAGWPAATGIFFSISLLWVMWNMLGLLERFTRYLGGGAIRLLVTILFGTVVSGYTGLVRPTDVPLGVNVLLWNVSHTWVDDPAVLFAYIPQHLFSIACLLAVLCFAASSTLSPIRLSIITAVLLASGILSSAILTLIFLIVAGPILILVSWPEKTPLRDALPSVLAGGVLLLAIVGPFMLEYMSWAGIDRPKIELVDANLFYTGLTFGPVLVLAMLGFIRLCVERKGRAGQLYAVICGSLVLLWVGVKFPELQLKASEGMRFLFIPAASWGFVWLWQWTRGLWMIRFATVVLVFIVPATGTLLETEYFVSSAYFPRSSGERTLLEAVDRLPSNLIIALQPPDQLLAGSLGGKLTLMDFRPARADAYLPASQRPRYAELMNSLRWSDSEKTVQLSDLADVFIVSRSSSSTGPWANPCGPDTRLIGQEYWLLDLRGCGKSGPHPSPAITLDAMKWERWGAAPSGSHQDLVTRTVSSPTEGDFGLLAPARLSAGVYRIRANISGMITGPSAGAAHISMHGKDKLINIQPGNYEDGKDFTGYYTLDTDFQGAISFGLGGWSRGAGWVRLNALTIERISPE